MKSKHRLIIEELSPGYRVIVLEATTWLKYGRSKSQIKEYETVEDWQEIFSQDFPKERDHAKVIKLALQWKQAYRIEQTERKRIK